MPPHRKRHVALVTAHNTRLLANRDLWKLDELNKTQFSSEKRKKLALGLE